MAGGGGGAHPRDHKRRSSSNWSELPQELLSLIFEHITDLSDLQQCLAVCPFWRSTASTVWGKIVATPLIFTINVKLTKDDQEKELLSKIMVFGVNNDNNPRKFWLRPPIDLVNTNCGIFGSYRGWLLTHYNTTNSSSEYEYNSLVYNPITRARVKLPPPPGGKCFCTLITSTSPTNPDCVVFAVFKQRNRYPSPQYILAFCKPGGETWPLIKSKRESYDDVIFYKGQFYAVDSEGVFFRLALKEESEQERVVEEKEVVVDCESRRLVEPRQVPNTKSCHYLVEESGTGELLMVEREVNLFFVPEQEYQVIMKTASFRIFKLKWKRRVDKAAEAEWEELRSFNHRALLLQYGDSMFVSTLEHTDYKSNCIYFTNERLSYADPMNSVYDFESHTIRQDLSLNVGHDIPNVVAMAGFLCRWFKASSSV